MGELEIEFHLKGKQKLSSYQIAVFNPDEVHASKNTNINSMGYYGLHINLQWCKDIQKTLFGSQSDFLEITSNILDDKTLYSRLHNCFQNILNNQGYSELEEILVDIFKRFAHIKPLHSKQDDENLFLQSVEAYILSNLENQITLKDIALEVGYNESYITRVFKKKFGLTPHAFIVNHKVNQAKKRLLASDEVNLAQLANEMGFYDQSHLNKTFKRVFAKSPKKYKTE